MSVYSILKEGLRGEGSEKMWCTTKILSDSIDEFVPEKQKESLMHKIYYSVNGGHFNEEFAESAMEKMYYIDSSKVKQHAPYWPEYEVKNLYNTVKSRIPDYNFYDFEVTLNMMKSDNCNKLRRWFPDATKEEITDKLVEEAVNYLDDDDNPYGKEKIWRYLNP